MKEEWINRKEESKETKLDANLEKIRKQKPCGEEKRMKKINYCELKITMNWHGKIYQYTKLIND